jgi:hypothetical protein
MPATIPQLHFKGNCRFGTPWMVNCAKPPEAISAAARNPP